MDIEHKIYIDNKLVKSFSSSVWYDTATPFQWCISELKELKKELQEGKSLEIISQDKNYKIENIMEFKTWTEKVFNGGFEKYVFD
jgi:hypothetical protein